MSVKKFYDTNHANSYLSNSIIMLGEEPIYVRDVIRKDGKDLIRYLTEPFEGKIKSISLTNKLVDFSPLPLGLANSLSRGQPRVVKISRMPTRNWKVGITRNNVMISDMLSGERLLVDNYIPSIALCNTVKDIYPEYMEAIDTMKTIKAGRVAFSRKFAIDDHLRIRHIHFDDYVGVHGSGGPTLLPSFEWMRGSLDEVLNG